MALLAVNSRGPGIIGLGPETHLRSATSESSAPSVPRSLLIGPSVLEDVQATKVGGIYLTVV